MTRGGAFVASEERVAGRLLARALDADKPACLQVRGRCMEPLIRDGDWVEVRAREPVRCGSVVLARGDSGELVCHRVLARTGDTLCLAGDRSLAAREHGPGSLLGVVRGVERGGSAWRLGGWRTRGPDRLLAGLHRLSLRCRALPAGRALEALRWRLLVSYGLLLAVAGSVVARSASMAGTSRRRRPASSR